MKNEHGVALPTIMVMLLVSSLLALNGWRSVWLNEMLLQSRADAIRTQWAADATLLAALDDMYSHHSDESAIAPEPSRYNMGASNQNHVFFPNKATELSVLRERLGGDDCREGICAPALPLQSTAKFWQGMTASSMPISSENSISLGKKAHYWIEIFLQDDGKDDSSFVYRITAMATGLKSPQPVVLHAIWEPSIATTNQKPLKPQGRWISWARLRD